MLSLTIDSFLDQQGPILDIRSPGEYSHGHIPDALSFPLFDNEERARIGTTYKKEGKREAVKQGLSLVGPKMRNFVEEAEKLGSEKLRLYCWRGGMRSASMAWLLEQSGFECTLLEKGYKAYRNKVIQFFDVNPDLRILTGYTGSGKTRILTAMKELGAQVVDLESLARHRGSTFGSEMAGDQPTTEQFQNDLLQTFLDLDPARPVWLEDESICIGSVSLPENLYHQMRKSSFVFVKANARNRIENLVNEYGSIDPEKLVRATKKIENKLGKAETQRSIELIRSKELSEAAGIILEYYDRQYRKSIVKIKDQIQLEINAENCSEEEIAKEILKHVN